jgi:hypothetical protein
MPDPLRLDHLVYAVPDLAKATDDVERRLGVRPTFGGRHASVGTHNAILPLQGATYVELIALDPEREQPPLPPPFGLAHLVEPRLATWAVRSFDVEADLARSREAGYDPGLLVPASRKTPDGRLLEWKLTVRPDRLGDGVVPFLIDWGTAPHPSHAHGAGTDRCTLRSLTGAHPDPVDVGAALEALGTPLDLESGERPALRAEIGGPGGALTLV